MLEGLFCNWPFCQPTSDLLDGRSSLRRKYIGRYDYYAVRIISAAHELMKSFLAVLDVSLTMGLTRCYKTTVFYIYTTTLHRTNGRITGCVFGYNRFMWYRLLLSTKASTLSHSYTSEIWCFVDCATRWRHECPRLQSKDWNIASFISLLLHLLVNGPFGWSLIHIAITATIAKNGRP